MTGRGTAAAVAEALRTAGAVPVHVAPYLSHPAWPGVILHPRDGGTVHLEGDLSAAAAVRLLAAMPEPTPALRPPMGRLVAMLAEPTAARLLLAALERDAAERDAAAEGRRGGPETAATLAAETDADTVAELARLAALVADDARTGADR